MDAKTRVLDALAHVVAKRMATAVAVAATLIATGAWVLGLDLALCVPAVLIASGGWYYWSLRDVRRDEQLSALGEDELRRILQAACSYPLWRWILGERAAITQLRSTALGRADVHAV